MQKKNRAFQGKYLLWRVSIEGLCGLPTDFLQVEGRRGRQESRPDAAVCRRRCLRHVPDVPGRPHLGHDLLGQLEGLGQLGGLEALALGRQGLYDRLEEVGQVVRRRLGVRLDVDNVEQEVGHRAHLHHRRFTCSNVVDLYFKKKNL